jgi:hypothetical protein
MGINHLVSATQSQSLGSLYKKLEKHIGSPAPILVRNGVYQSSNDRIHRRPEGTASSSPKPDTAHYVVTHIAVSREWGLS